MASLDYCEQCNNLLYPEQDRTNHILMYACRNCDYKKEATHNMVFRNDLMSVTKEQPGVVDNITSDPTLARTRELPCPECGNLEIMEHEKFHHREFWIPASDQAVSFQDQSKRIFNRMILFYVCTRCNHLFKDSIAAR